MKLPRFLSKMIPGFEVIDLKEWISKGTVEIFIKKLPGQNCTCSRCGSELAASHGKYPIRLKAMPILNFTTYLVLWREKRYCPTCKKVRSEYLEFSSARNASLNKRIRLVAWADV